MKNSALCLTAALCLVAAMPAPAQSTPKPVMQTEVTTIQGTVVAIDYTNRDVTIKGPKKEITIHAGEEATRFAAIKVGDIVTAKYVEAVVLAIRNPRIDPSSGDEVVTRTPGDKPGAMVSRQLDVDVTVKEIDRKAPSLTVTTEDGRTLAFKVEDPSRIKGLKAGDVIRMTYMESVALTVEAPKAAN